MNKITFKDVAHMYLGCKIQTAEGIGTFNELAVGDEPIHEPITSYDLVKAHLSFDEVKPVLRRGEKLNDAEIASIWSRHNNFSVNTDEPHAVSAFMAWAFTREGVDLFGLIDNGEAIDAATLGEEVQP